MFLNTDKYKTFSFRLKQFKMEALYILYCGFIFVVFENVVNPRQARHVGPLSHFGLVATALIRTHYSKCAPKQVV